MATRVHVRRISELRVERHSPTRLMEFSALYENSSRMKKSDELCVLHQRLVSVAGARLRQILITTAINLQDDAGIASLSDMVITIQCGLCPEIVDFFHRYTRKRGRLFDPYGISVDFFERNQHSVDFHTLGFLGRSKRYLRQMYDADQ